MFNVHCIIIIHSTFDIIHLKVVEDIGVEPMTFPMYIGTLYPVELINIFPFISKVVEDIGVEPMTSCVQGRRSSQLS